MKIYQCDNCHKWFMQTEACVDKCITLKAHGTCCHRHEVEAIREATKPAFFMYSSTMSYMLSLKLNEAQEHCEPPNPLKLYTASKVVM